MSSFLGKIKEFFKNDGWGKRVCSICLVIAEIFAGIYIASIVEFNQNRELEKIQLRAKVVENRIDKVMTLMTLIQEPILTIQTNESELAKRLDGYDGSTNNCVVILKDLETFGNWATEFHQLASENRFLFNEEINLQITYIFLYNQKLDMILSNIPENEVWQVGVVLHSEIAQMYQTLSQLLQDYLNTEIYELETKEIDSYSRHTQLSNDFYIVKYEKQIISILTELNTIEEDLNNG